MTGSDKIPGFDDRSGLNDSSGFKDGKDPGALRTIGEVAAGLGIRQHVLRYWEEQFPMLRPVKRAGGRRYYRPEDISLIAHIHRLVHQEGYTLRGARLALGGEEPKPVEEGRDLVRELRVIRDQLAAALAQA